MASMLPPQRRNLIGKLISFPSLLVSLKHSLLFHHVMKLLNSGANWKCNGTTEQTEELITMLNSGSEYPASSEVVVAVPGSNRRRLPLTQRSLPPYFPNNFFLLFNFHVALQLQNCKAKFAADIAVSAQDVSIMDGLGAYTGTWSAYNLNKSFNSICDFIAIQFGQ